MFFQIFWLQYLAAHISHAIVLQYYILYIALFEESTRRWSFEPRRAIKDPKTAPGEQDALLVSNSSQQVLSVYFMTHMFSQEHWESHIYWGPGSIYWNPFCSRNTFFVLSFNIKHDEQ